MYNLSSAKKGAVLPKFLLGFLFMAGLLLSRAVSRPIVHADPGELAWQSFEASPPANAWNYTVNPATYNTEGDLIVNGPESVWAAIEEFTNEIDAPSDGDRFWGMQDLDNSNGGGNFDHTITFDPIDVSAYGALEIRFDYNVFEFDNGDDLEYEITLDGTPQGRILLFEGSGDASTSGWETETVAVPGSANSVSLQLIADQNGLEDFAGWDNVWLIDVSTDFPPTVDSTDPADAAVNVPVAANITVTFSEDVTVSGAWFAITCTSSGAHSATVSGANPGATFTLDPAADFANSETCTATIFAGQVADVDGTADNMTADYTWSFDVIPLTEPIGAIVINEIMQNPGAVSDTAGEWFEIYNTTGTPIDLQGWVIRDADTDSHTINTPLNVAPGAYIVLCKNTNNATNGGVTCDYEYSGFTLANGDDEVILEESGVPIDQVFYDGGPDFPDPTGASMSYGGPGASSPAPHVDNDDGARWGEATSSYGGSDLGTPGARNDDVLGPTAVSLHALTAAGAAPIPLLLAIAGLLALTLAWTRRPH